MFRQVVTSAQRLLAETSHHRAPDRVALGIALGASLGMVPMDNLLSVSVFVAILFLPVHQLAAAIACLIVASLGFVVAPIPETIGRWLLGQTWLRSMLASVHSLPLVPWLRLNNTLVLGGFFTGVCTVLPNYLVLRWIARRSEKKLANWAMEELAEQAASYRKENVTTQLRKRTALAHSTVHEGGIDPLPHLPMEFAPAHAMGWVGPQRRIDPPVSQSLDQLSIDPMRVPSPELAAPMPTSFAEPKTSETILRETIIEVVRFRDDVCNLTSSSAESPRATMILESSSMLGSPSTSSNPGPAIALASTRDPSESVQRIFDPAQQPLTGPKSSESLRYLLRHLNAARSIRSESEIRS